MLARISNRTEPIGAEHGGSRIPFEEGHLGALGAIFRKLYLGRKTILVSILAGVASATTVAFLIPPTYTAKASFIPPTSVSSSTAAMLLGQFSQIASLTGGGVGGGITSPGQLYVGILKSRSIADKLIERFGLMSVYRVKRQSQAEKTLTKNSEFVVGLKDSIVTVSVTDKSPTRARDIVNGYLDLLYETNGRLALTESSQRRMFFEQQLVREKDALADAEVDLKKSQEQSGLVAPERQTATEIQMTAQTRAEIGARRVQLAALAQSATSQNPEFIRLQSEIGNLQGQLNQLLKGQNEKGNGAIPTSKVPQLALDYVRKLREVKYHEALFEILSKQYEAARLDESREGAVLQVLDRASVPDSKSSPRRGWIVAGGLVLGLMAGSFWVLFGSSLRAFCAAVFRFGIS
jgi:tyrosine-protein kinase Etk/Wzc